MDNKTFGQPLKYIGKQVAILAQEPFWLKQFLFKRCVARARLPKVTVFVVSILCVPVRRIIMVRKWWSVMELLSDGWVTSGKEDSDEDGARESSLEEVTTQVTGDAGQSQKSRTRIVRLGTGRECREGTNSGSVTARQGGSVSLSVPTQTPSRLRAVAKVARLQRDSDALDVFGPEVDAIKKALKKASRGRTRTTRCRICQRVQGFHRALHQTSHQVEGGVGVRDRIVGGGSCPVAEVGSTTGSASWGTGCGKRGPHVDVATDGESVAGGMWFIVPRIASESCTQGKAMVWWRTSRCQCNFTTMPDHFHNLQEWLNTRNRELRDALEFRSPDVIAHLSHLLSQGASQLASICQGASAQDPNAMEVHGGPGTRMSALIDAADVKRRC